MNLARTANLASFVADEVAVGYRSRTVGAPVWDRVDTIESETSAQNRGCTRQHTRVNGKPWNEPDLPAGVGWSVLFGYDLKALFDRDCHTAIQYAGSTDAGGRPTLDYRFHAEPGNCFGKFSRRSGLMTPRYRSFESSSDLTFRETS